MTLRHLDLAKRILIAVFLQDECSWDAREDLRKPISRQQVEALQTRIADLEKMLKDHGLDPGHTSPGHTDAEMPERKITNDVDREDTSDRESGADWPESHLVENETGDFQVYGPTSAFRHLSISQQTRTSPTEGSSMPGFRKYLPQDVDVTEDEHELALDRFFRYYAAWGELLLMCSKIPLTLPQASEHIPCSSARTCTSRYTPHLPRKHHTIRQCYTTPSSPSPFVFPTTPCYAGQRRGIDSRSRRNDVSSKKVRVPLSRRFRRCFTSRAIIQRRPNITWVGCTWEWR
jgi:hypothetical protein